MLIRFPIWCAARLKRKNLVLAMARNSSARIHRYYLAYEQRYTYRVHQTIQMKLILLCVWAEPAVLGSAKTALKFKYEI